jgi:hypothetical protein
MALMLGLVLGRLRIRRVATRQQRAESVIFGLNLDPFGIAWLRRVDIASRRQGWRVDGKARAARIATPWLSLSQSARAEPNQSLPGRIGPRIHVCGKVDFA